LPVAEPAPIAEAPSLVRDDPEARQTRRLALLASLSDGLPTLPAYVFELNTLLSAKRVDLKRVAEVICTDPSLTAQMLRICNSAFLSLPTKVKSIEHAVILLGAERLRTLVLTCSLLEYVGHSVASEDVQSFWQHSFLTATLSERLARGTRYSQPEQVYLGGLLHDIGALPILLFTSSERELNQATSSRLWSEDTLHERQLFGTDHCEIGRWIGISWNFPVALLEVIVRHHTPAEAVEDPGLVGMVAAADRFCVGRGAMLGAACPELPGPEARQNHALLRECIPGLSAEEAGKLGEMLEMDYLHLIQLMEFGAAGLFGGGIPRNPFRESGGLR
jgi:HD-like signal output (HDOD) protein